MADSPLEYRFITREGVPPTLCKIYIEWRGRYAEGWGAEDVAKLRELDRFVGYYRGKPSLNYDWARVRARTPVTSIVQLSRDESLDNLFTDGECLIAYTWVWSPLLSTTATFDMPHCDKYDAELTWSRNRGYCVLLRNSWIDGRHLSVADVCRYAELVCKVWVQSDYEIVTPCTSIDPESKR